MRPVWKGCALVLATIVCWSGVGRAGDPGPRSARSGLDLAREAALAWAADAHFAYLENDDALGPDGNAARWGYLFYSPSRDAARGYSIENDKIVQATDLGVRFDAPPIGEGWIDSQSALTAAQAELKGKLAAYVGPPSTMLLMRGAFDEKSPDRTCWLVCFRADGLPALFLVVDATSGDVVRNWRG
ncbi:MAG: hypothetical protein R3E12_10690 [Candidatus Eisenbacteria bacterium]|uniref:PepSY domain-containing protein n=1 Tax=Eiseniibacteriota bacterium TaxID=2212470 RepID=A0A956M1G4_UNCEI|nr:hypothetical protein [Candidatus Eisenbacteria bacterium]